MKLLSISIILRFIYVTTFIKTHYVLSLSSISLFRYTVCSFLHLLMSFWVQVLATIDKDAISICVQIFRHTFSFLQGKYLQVEGLDIYLLKNLRIVFHNGCTIYSIYSPMFLHNIYCYHLQVFTYFTYSIHNFMQFSMVIFLNFNFQLLVASVQTQKCNLHIDIMSFNLTKLMTSSIFWQIPLDFLHRQTCHLQIIIPSYSQLLIFFF